MNYSEIIGVGSSVPKLVVSNDDLSEFIETNDEWITARTGIKRRRIAVEKNTSDLAFESAVAALKNAGIDKHEVDTIIVATFSPDQLSPSVACLLVKKLQLKSRVMAFDLNAACTGFIYGLEVAKALIENGTSKCTLLIGAEVLSKIMNWEDRNTCVLFGDAAGAIVLKVSEEEKVLKSYVDSSADINNVLGVAKEFNNKFKDYVPVKEYLYMNGAEVFKFAVKAVRESIEKVLELNNLNIEDIDYIIPHQANYRIISRVANKMGIDINKFYLNLEEYGNTSAASIPLALSEAVASKVIKEGDKLLLVGFGAGMTYGATIIKY